MDEFHVVVMSLAPWKTPDLDGFPPWFYQHQYNLIKDDLFSFLSNAFSLQSDLSQCNTTLLILIPKYKTPKYSSDWRPISLYNTCYKILSKLLCLRLKAILHELLEPNQ